MRNFGLALLPLCGLIVATPITDPPQSVDINNPSASDPKIPPKQISFPKRPDNPFPNGIPTHPDKCDGEFPSDDCFHTIGSSGGYLYYENDSGCSDNQKNVLETALWEATTLASYSSNFPNNGEGSRGSASAHFYMGPDYLSQKDRISGNLQRISEFKSGKTSEKAYITMSCKDTKNLCNERGQGTVGGYAWTYNGWFGYYHYITFCPPFFSLDNIDQKITEIESELSGGKTEKASDMRYLRTTGQYFLHEMMHTRIADGGKEPHITDEGVVEPGRTYPGNPAAYGPNLVHKLAQRPINQNGGATRASTNADSYAILANCAWWWDTTGYFPGVPGKYGPSSAEDDFPISLWIDLGNTTSPSEFDFASLFSADAEGFESSATTILTIQTTTALTATATADNSRKDSYNFTPIPPEGHSTLPGTRQSPSFFSSSTPPGSSGIRYTVPVRPGVSPLPSTSPKPTVGLSSSAPLGTEQRSSELFRKVGDTLSPEPVVVGSKAIVHSLAAFIPIISGGPITSPSATSNPTLGTIAPTSTEAPSSISHLSAELVGLIRTINSWVEHPDAPEATGVIHAIENIRPGIEGLLNKLEPDPSSSSCKSTSRNRIKRDLSSRSALSPLFDLVDSILCSVNDITNSVKNNILNDVKSNLKNLQNEVGNLAQGTEPESLSQSSSEPSTSSSSCSAPATVSDCSVICDVSTLPTSTLSCSTTCYSTFSDCSATGTTTTTTVQACSKPSGWGNVADGEDFPMAQHLGTSSIAAPSGASAPGRSTSITSSLGLGTGPTSSVPVETSVGSSTLSSASATIKSSTSVPDCLADGAPWYSPTSWCDCGLSSTYPTLPVTPGATTANCAYTSLPVSTIQPARTSAAPTNIPGQGGISACVAVASSKETSAYCNCGGTFAPTLNPTASGLLNCAYTVLPTSSYNPGRTPPSATPAPSYAPGKCNVHIVQALGQEFSDPEVAISVNITDANGTPIGNNKGPVEWGQTLDTDSLLPWVLLVTPQSGISKRRSPVTFLRKRVGGPIHSNRPLFESGPVDFAYASQTWDTSSSQCSVGGWDNGNANDFFASLIAGENFFPNRQIDCLFDCPALDNSEKRDVVEHHDEEWKQDLKSPSPTISNDPSPIAEQLYEIRDVNPQVSHGAAWVKYAPSGARYFREWQDKTGADIVYPCNFDDFFNIVSLNRAQPASGVRAILQEAGYGTSREYLAISIEGPKDNPIADFTNTISATQGVFLANANDRGSPPVAWQFSTVAWVLWQKTVLTENPEWKNDPSKADYSGIKSFWRREIDNQDTQSILNEAFTDLDVNSIQTWYPGDTNQDTNPFWALLGSPNGNGIQHFLTDNKVELKGKGVISISAVMGNSGYYTMWATFG